MGQRWSTTIGEANPESRTDLPSQTLSSNQNNASMTTSKESTFEQHLQDSVVALRSSLQRAASLDEALSIFERIAIDFLDAHEQESEILSAHAGDFLVEFLNALRNPLESLHAQELNSLAVFSSQQYSSPVSMDSINIKLSKYKTVNSLREYLATKFSSKWLQFAESCKYQFPTSREEYVELFRKWSTGSD